MEFIVSDILEATALVRDWNKTGQYSQVTEISFFTDDDDYLGRIENTGPDFGFIWQPN